MSYADYSRARPEMVTCSHCGATVPEGNDCDCPAMFVEVVDLVEDELALLRRSAANVDIHNAEAAAELRALTEPIRAWREKWLAVAKGAL